MLSEARAQEPFPTERRPLRVLLVTEASSAGVGRHVIDLAAGLIDLGCDVHLLYSPLRIDQPFARGAAELGEDRVTELRMRRAPGPDDLRAHRELARYLRQRPPFDVVHAHSSKAGLLARTVRTNAAVLYTPHCIYTMNPTARRVMYHATRMVERALARRADGIIAVSPDERDHMVDIGLERSRVRYIPNGLQPPQWRGREDARRELGFGEEHVVLGFLGRLSHQKNPLMLVRAFAELARTRPELRMCMVGDGELEADTRRLAHELGVDAGVVWTGHRTPETVMPAFDVFTLPSRYEAMPYVLLEALSAGLPIVSTPVGGANATIDDGENGFISDGQDVAQFVRALTPVVSDAGLRARLGARSLHKSTAFSATVMVRATLDLYHELIEARAHALSG